MVRHQAIGVHCAAKFAGELAQVKEIENAVVVRPEANPSVGATLDDVRGYISKENA